MEEDFAFVGTKLKYAVNINAYGFDMAEDDFCIDLIRGKKSLHFDKDELVSDGDGHYNLCFDSNDLGEGLVIALVTIKVPDPDFPDGVRTGVIPVHLVYLKKPPCIWDAPM